MLRPEQALQITVVDYLRRATIAPARFWFCPNGGNLSRVQSAMFQRMGLMPGVADLHFMWSPSRYGVIEMKAGKGRLTDEQRQFASDTMDNGHPWGEARSLEEVVALLRLWGYPLRPIRIM